MTQLSSRLLQAADPCGTSHPLKRMGRGFGVVWCGGALRGRSGLVFMALSAGQVYALALGLALQVRGCPTAQSISRWMVRKWVVCASWRRHFTLLSHFLPRAYHKSLVWVLPEALALSQNINIKHCLSNTHMLHAIHKRGARALTCAAHMVSSGSQRCYTIYTGESCHFH